MNMRDSLIFITMIFATTYAMEEHQYNFLQDSVTYTKEDLSETYSAPLRNDLYSQADKASGYYNEQTLSAQKKLKNNQVTIKYYLIQKWSVTPLPDKKNDPALFDSLKKAYDNLTKEKN